MHLSYGNAKTEEDIDIYAPLEFRALRGLHAAQQVLRAGFTAIADPATTGLVSLAIRDAIRSGLFVGPRITSSGRQITNHRGLSDWYPSWIGVPSTSIGVLARTAEEGITEIRRQVKDGVDIVKLALDGDSMNPSTGLVCGYTQDETTATVREAHRLGRKVVAHARRAEAVLYAARAEVDVIFHASFMDDHGLEEVVRSGSALCPTMSLVVNDIAFTRSTDGCFPTFPDAHRRELDAAMIALDKARRAGVTFMLGTDSGFAVTPYGEWPAAELEYYMRYLGFSAAETLVCATSNNASLLRDGERTGVIEVGRQADLLAVDGDPTADITILQDRDRLRAVWLDGEVVQLPPARQVVRLPVETSYNMWSNVYTREHAARVGFQLPPGRNTGEGTEGETLSKAAAGR